MKKQFRILNFFLVGIMIFTLFNCGQSKKTNNIDSLIFTEGNKRIELVLEGGKNYLIIDKPTKANFVTENIDNTNFLINGYGIRRIRESNSEYDWEITPPKNYLIDGKLKIEMVERMDNGEYLNAVFLVSVKEME